MRVLCPGVLLAAALLLGATATGSLHPAAAAEIVPIAGQTLTVELSEGVLVRIDEPAAAVFLANPDIADVAVKSPRLIYVFGKRTGETTLYAVDEEERILLNMRVSVTHNLSRLRQAIQDLIPGSGITVQSLDSGVVLAGTVPTGADAENARRLAARFIGEKEEVIMRMAVMEANQVNLRVRVAEVARSVIRQLGIDWSAAYSEGAFAFGVTSQQFVEKALQFGSVAQQADAGFFKYNGADFDINAVIDALAEEDLVSVLAEPNLTAVSGETASFLAGGEFPVPVAQDTGAGGDTTITVVFKSFGVSLAFTPTLIGGNRINMRVRPEVSALSTEGAVQISGFDIPALTVREAETTVELASGQSFAIAGLIQNNARLDAEHIPGLGSLPILGELFRSSRFRRDETELVIIVTPYIVEPVANPQLMASPTDATTGPQGTQRLSQGTGGATASAAPAPGGLAGPVGFVIE